MAEKRNLEGERLHHFELSDKNRTVRWVLIIILLAIGAGAIIWALIGALQTPAGWQSIEASSTKMNCSHEFVLQYDLGAGEKSASVENKELSLLYGQSAENAWQLFYHEADGIGAVGLSRLNDHPNQELVVDAAFYQALEKITANGNRLIYAGPMFEAYDEVFQSADAIIAEDNDPTADPETKAYMLEIAAFIQNTDHVELELRGENRVFLKVSSDYLNVLEQNSVARILDFGWMRNAFAVDYMARQLTDNGFTNGYFVSVDGLTRNLDQRTTVYSMDIVMDKQLAAVMQYTGAKSIVSLRSYPMYQENSDRYYTFPDGRTVSSMIDLTDGQSKCAADDLISYATDKDCAELALALMPVYVADTLSEDGLNSLTQQGIYSIWCVNRELRYNQPDLSLTAIDSAYQPTPVVFE